MLRPRAKRSSATPDTREGPARRIEAANIYSRVATLEPPSRRCLQAMPHAFGRSNCAQEGRPGLCRLNGLEGVGIGSKSVEAIHISCIPSTIGGVSVISIADSSTRRLDHTKTALERSAISAIWSEGRDPGPGATLNDNFAHGHRPHRTRG